MRIRLDPVPEFVTAAEPLPSGQLRANAGRYLFDGVMGKRPAIRMRLPRLLAAVTAVVVAAVLFYVSSNRPTPIMAYRLVDQRTIVVTAAAAEATWTRLTGVVESDDAVRIYVESLEWPGTRTAQANLIEFTVVLSRDLGQREIRDGAGLVVPHVEPTVFSGAD